MSGALPYLLFLDQGQHDLLQGVCPHVYSRSPRPQTVRAKGSAQILGMPADGLFFLAVAFLYRKPGPALFEDATRSVGGDDPALTEYRDAVAKHRLVHQVRADKQGRAASG